ncbi:hypothetical protein K469DRAFT_676570 [Zopfia rhizophila CBS 207.26]|uniref:Rhodopsin domain-containing protein n=1 Tax=Zopfia rhizophila CBS 207.26 TaxID=1314779 RepID=A0A6A6DHG2_9PEZI|nr:hypothetical protein K469DRAFT_676570 [Zopfia rhizophila CBS 207.26]
MSFAANQNDLLITVGILMPATMIVIGLRFFARQRLRARKGPDDWLALAAGIVFWANCFAMVWGVYKDYVGLDPLKMDPFALVQGLKVCYPEKPSRAMLRRLDELCRILFLYYRLFGIYASFRIALIVVGVASIAWMLTVWFVTIFRCNPISAAWNVFLVIQGQAHCLNQETIFLITETINAILDVSLVCLPISKLHILQLPLRDRIGLGFVFVTGEALSGDSILRIVFTYDGGALLDSIFWLDLQLATAIICACLPTLRSLLPTQKTFIPLSSAIQRLLGSRMISSSATAKSSQQGSSVSTSDDLSKSMYRRYANLSKDGDDEIALTGVRVDARSASQV